MRVSTIARLLRIEYPGVSQAYYRVEKARKDDKRLYKTIRKIAKRLTV
jgi:hypothetical protein